MNDPESEARNEGWHEGYSAGLLDAAKICDTEAADAWVYRRQFVHGVASKATAEKCAECIRARAAAVSGRQVKVNANFVGRKPPLPMDDGEVEK